MIFFIIALPFLAASSVQLYSRDVKLIDTWECGPDNSRWAIIANFVTRRLVSYCHEHVQADANLCCKAHDHCYDAHSLTNVDKYFCDKRFCNCLQDVTDRAKERECKTELDNYCSAVNSFGARVFDKAAPNKHDDLLLQFSDAEPWGLDMRRLVDSCQHSKKMAVHCHNSAVKCLAKPHERAMRQRDAVIREKAFQEHSYQDCRSTMYDCLQTIIESGDNETCTFVARSLTKQILVYAKLDEERHGKAIIDTYPIVASRLLTHCNESTHPLESCYIKFDNCAQQNRQESPELYNAARRIKIVCHKELRSCVDSVTTDEGNSKEGCSEARSLAISLIRDYDLEDDKPMIVAVFDTVKEKVVEKLEATAGAVSPAAKTVVGGLKSAKDAVKRFWNKWKPWE